MESEEGNNFQHSQLGDSLRQQIEETKASQNGSERYRRMSRLQIRVESSQMIRHYRLFLGLSILDAAKSIKMSHLVLGRLERAEREINAVEFATIMKAYGIDPKQAVAELLTGNWQRNPESIFKDSPGGPIF